MPVIEKHGKYCLERFDAPIDVGLAISINNLCYGFGDHYKNYFGPDFIERMTNQRGGAIICIAYIDDENYANIENKVKTGGSIEICSTANILYDPDDQKGVSTLHNVFTHSDHRRQGLSKMLVKKVLEAYDRDIGGSFCVLGTGSPFAAKTYQENGFFHLAGGFDTNGPKGYNPDDLGEWIMIRSCKSQKFDPSIYYSISKQDQLNVVPVKTTHYTQLVLLFNAINEGDVKKCVALGIESGIQAEEKLIKFFQSKVFKKSQKTLCYVAVVDNRVFGIAACRDGTTNIWDIYSCMNQKVIESILHEKINHHK